MRGVLDLGQRVGLLGGSFNPAHDGHRHISELALKYLALHQVWWLVSPQNPLKPGKGMAPLDDRLARARRVAGHRRIVPTDLEARFGTRYTADTLAALRRRFARARFVWLIGADNLAQFPQWRNWTQIFHTVPVAVFDRPSYSKMALGGLAAVRFAECRRPAWEADRLADTDPPAWIFFHSPLHPISATALRARGETA
jgi:nicotinate-nucleotide adenylyltransferase